LRIPPRLVAACDRTPERSRWLKELPRNLVDLEHRWSLMIGPPIHSEEATAAWVAPVTLADRRPAMLKLSMPHMEGRDEIAGLRFWNGEPTVRLLEADEGIGAMLLEQCRPGTALRAVSESEQDIVLATLLRHLWRTPSTPRPFRHLSVMMSYWHKETLGQAKRWSDPGLVRGGLRLLETLSRPAPGDVLLATDLHAGNVLRAERKPWLVIDPKPFVGDPSYDATQHLLNCSDRLRQDPVGTVARFSDLLGVDQERVRLWLFARCAAEPRATWRGWQTDLARAMEPP